jgi:hypothetical protein
LLPLGRALPQQPLVGWQRFGQPRCGLEFVFVVGVDYQNSGS